MSNDAAITSNLLEFIVLSHIKMIRPLSESFKPMLSPLQTNVVLLLKINGSMTMTQLVDKLLMPKQQMTQIARHLQDIGFISRSIDRNDHRRIIVALTEKAQEYIDENINAYLKTIFFENDDLSGKDKRQFVSSVATLSSLMNRLSAEK